MNPCPKSCIYWRQSGLCKHNWNPNYFFKKCVICPNLVQPTGFDKNENNFCDKCWNQGCNDIQRIHYYYVMRLRMKLR